MNVSRGPIRGQRKAGRKHLSYTPDLILTIVVSIMDYRNWSERIPFIESRHPELKGHFTYKNLEERARLNGWVKLAKATKAAIMEQTQKDLSEKGRELFGQTAEAELATLKDLLTESERIRASIKLLEPSDKGYAIAMASLLKITDQIGKLGGTDRLRRVQDLNDKVNASLSLEERKAALKQLGGGADPTKMAQDAGDTAMIGEESESFAI